MTRAQAQSIVGVRLLEPLEAPQGPTCIYRTAANKNVITLAVQSASIENLRRQMRDRVRVRVGDKVAYCGTLGRPTLYVPLSAGRVLSITAACDIAKRFAVKALPRVAA